MSANEEPKSIVWQIERLARETAAPTSFVEQVHAFFHAKGISLSDDAEPYLVALEEAFQLEETVRRNTRWARENLVRLQECVRLVGATYQQQLGQLRRVRDSLDQQGRLVREGAQRLRELSRSATQGRTAISGPKGTFLVPGPRDLQ